MHNLFVYMYNNTATNLFLFSHHTNHFFVFLGEALGLFPNKTVDANMFKKVSMLLKEGGKMPQ